MVLIDYIIIILGGKKLKMNCQFDLKIANLKSSLAKENDMKYYEDYEYTDDILNKVFAEYSLSINGKNRAKFNYMQESMPNMEEMKSIVQDILEFYENNFMTYPLEKTFKMQIRFFLHVKFMHLDGDACGNEIRISCKNLTESNKGNVSFSKFIEYISYEKGEYFKNQLRSVLAHEIYHLLHFNHCDSIEKKHSSNIYEAILDEIFANYFSYEYVLDFLGRTEGKDTITYNQKRNSIFDWYNDIKYFGVGRKYLFPNDYPNEEIEEDKKQLMVLMENDATKRSVETSHYPVSLAEYAAGYYLSFYEEKHRDELDGDRQLYTQMYQEYLSGNAVEALLRLIRIKEIEY